MRPDAHTSATLVVTPSAMGFRKARFAAPVRCQYSESPTTKSSTVSVAGKHNNGGMPGLGADPDDLILGVSDAQDRTGVLSDQRDGERHERRRDEWNDFQHELTSWISVQWPR